MSRLLNYIKNIDSNTPINLNSFFKCVDKLRLSQRCEPQNIKTTKIKGSLYTVDWINDELMRELRILAADDGQSRALAATQNRSHSVKVNGSFLLMRGKSENPVVVMIDGTGEFYYPTFQSKQALVIENRQNFIDVEVMIAFLEKHTAFEWEQEMNVIFSEGNEISNALHKKFLSNYDRIYLCMDVDLGGLTIAKNLMTLLPDTEFNFLVPDDIEKRLDRVVERESPHYIEDVIKIGLSTSVLAPYAKLIKDKQKTLEQESYLHE